MCDSHELFKPQLCVVSAKWPRCLYCCLSIFSCTLSLCLEKLLKFLLTLVWKKINLKLWVNDTLVHNGRIKTSDQKYCVYSNACLYVFLRSLIQREIWLQPGWNSFQNSTISKLHWHSIMHVCNCTGLQKYIKSSPISSILAQLSNEAPSAKQNL